jgi:hypothetical protein
MTGITNSFAHVMLVPAQSFALWLSLHNGDPLTNGAQELAISPYNRSPASWQTPVQGKLTLGVPVHIPTNANSSVGFYGMWNQRTLGTFCGGTSLSAVETFTAPGTYTISSLNFSLVLA